METREEAPSWTVRGLRFGCGEGKRRLAAHGAHVGSRRIVDVIAASSCIVHTGTTSSLAMRLEGVSERAAAVGAERRWTVFARLESTDLGASSLDGSSAFRVFTSAGGIVNACLLQFRHLGHQLHV